MSSSEEDSSEEEDMLVYLYLRNRRRRRRRKYWVHPYIRRNKRRRLFIAARELRQNDGKFHAFYRMSKESFQELLRVVAPFLHKQNTVMRECISAEERLLITLR